MPTITFRCSDQVADWIRADAKRAGMTATDFIIARCCGKPGAGPAFAPAIHVDAPFGPVKRATPKAEKGKRK